MDDRTLRQIDALLRAYPAAWDDDSALLDELLAEAAGREAAGEPVALSNPQLAAYLALHPNEADRYAELVWLIGEPPGPAPTPAQLAAVTARLRPAPPAAPVTATPAAEWLRRTLAEITAAFTPLKLNYGGGVTRSERAAPAAIDERVGEVDQRGQPLGLSVRLRVRDERASIYLRLKAPPGEAPPDMADASVALFEAVQSGPAISGGAARTVVSLARGDALFNDLDPEQGYMLAVAAPGQPLVLVAIAPGEWPE